jgi:putative transposase
MEQISYYHVTAKAKDKKWFGITMEEVWKTCADSLKQAHNVRAIPIISFVLMNNHYHLLVKTNPSKLKAFLEHFHKLLTPSIQLTTYHMVPIASYRYFLNCYRYIYQNPQRAGITHTCEHYPYSTLFYLSKGESFITPLHDKTGHCDEFKRRWINSKLSQQECENISKVLSGNCR